MNEKEKPLLFKRHKAVRFLISPKKKKVKIEVNKIMNPFLWQFIMKDSRCNRMKGKKTREGLHLWKRDELTKDKRLDLWSKEE